MDSAPWCTDLYGTERKSYGNYTEISVRGGQVPVGGMTAVRGQRMCFRRNRHHPATRPVATAVRRKKAQRSIRLLWLPSLTPIHLFSPLPEYLHYARMVEREGNRAKATESRTAAECRSTFIIEKERNGTASEFFLYSRSIRCQ